MLEEYNNLPNLILGDPKYCIYCGEYPESLDHVIPYSFYNFTKTGYRKGHKKLVVYSCRHCNSILSNLMFSNFKKRRLYLRRRLFLKNKKILRIGNFSKNELDELEGNLKKMVRGGCFVKELLTKRLEWQDTSTFFKIENAIKEKIIEKEEKEELSEYLANYFLSEYEFTEEERVAEENIDLYIQTGRYQVK
jgi:hypothetical protein